MVKTTQAVERVTAKYLQALDNSLEEHESLLNKAETVQEREMLNAMIGQLINFNDKAIQAIQQAAERLKSGNV